MRDLIEHIAREVNKEDVCTGRFWEERFKSQALSDEAVLLARMAYVDLNTIRAKIADIPETSEHTSIQQRMKAIQRPDTHSLMLFVGNTRQYMPKGIAFSLKDYCELMDITGRIIRNDKADHIDHQNQHILKG
jgi:hypothetical protein